MMVASFDRSKAAVKLEFIRRAEQSPQELYFLV